MDVLVKAEEIPLCTDFARKTRAKVAVAFGLLATLSILAGCFVPFAMIGMISMALGMLNSMGVFGDGKLSQIIGMVSMVGSMVGMAGSIMCPGGGIGWNSADGMYMGAERFTSIQGAAGLDQRLAGMNDRDFNQAMSSQQHLEDGSTVIRTQNGAEMYNQDGQLTERWTQNGNRMTQQTPNGTTVYRRTDDGRIFSWQQGSNGSVSNFQQMQPGTVPNSQIFNAPRSTTPTSSTPVGVRT